MNGRGDRRPRTVVLPEPVIEPIPRKTTVFGAGYVGLVTAACFAQLGHRVRVCDIDPKRIRQIRAEALPFEEPGLARLVTRNRERLSYTDDAREALADTEIFYISGATVSGWDPLAKLPATEPWTLITRCDTPLRAVRGADAALIVTEWPELAELDWREVHQAMRHPVVFDGRNLLDPQQLHDLAFTYSDVGRPRPV